jgi:6-phosphogluconolactonase
VTRTIRRFGDLDALSRAATAEFISLAQTTIRDRGTFAVALSGGSTPKRLFQLLAAEGRDALAWDHVELWWGDERTVPPDHPDSNYHMTREALIEPLELDPAHVHRINAELPDPVVAADAYDRALRQALGAPPVFDLVLLGLGPDGHTASLFPHTKALTAVGHFVVANPVDSPVAKGKTTRITLTAPALCAARHVRFLVAGADKQDAVAAVLAGPPDPHCYPAQLLAAATGDVVWMLDDAAAAKLPAHVHA